jgi:uncharacterized protein YjdB
VYVEDESLYKINTLVYPANTTIKNATYVSSNPEFLKVSQDGKLYNLVNSKGLEISITVTVGNIQSVIKVVVEIKNFVELKDITATVKQSIYVGESANLSVGYVPSNATYKQYKLSTGDKQIVSVSNNNKISGVKAGSTTIKIESVENQNIFSIVPIEVKAKEDIVSFDVTKKTYDLYEKGTATISISNIKPNQYANKSGLKYKSINEGVAKVEGTGETATVTAIALGTAKITASCNFSGKEYSQTCEISVMQTPELKIGDYVNYPVEYTNVATWYDSSTGAEKGNYPRDEFTGWRVLSKETDDQGNILYIKLISAGVPLSYYHYDNSDTRTDGVRQILRR